MIQFPVGLSPVHTVDGVELTVGGEVQTALPFHWSRNTAVAGLAFGLCSGAWMLAAGAGPEAAFFFAVWCALVIVVGIHTGIARVEAYGRMSSFVSRKLSITDHWVWADGCGGTWQTLEQCVLGQDAESNARIELTFAGPKEVHIPMSNHLVDDVAWLHQHLVDAWRAGRADEGEVRAIRAGVERLRAR